MVGSTTARVRRAWMTWVGVASGIWGVRRALGIQRVEAVAVGHVLPLVVAGPGDAEDPAGLGHVPGSLGVVQHGDAPLVDDLCWGHGDGLLGSLVGTTESIAGPHHSGGCATSSRGPEALEPAAEHRISMVPDRQVAPYDGGSLNQLSWLILRCPIGVAMDQAAQRQKMSADEAHQTRSSRCDPRRVTRPYVTLSSKQTAELRSPVANGG